MRKQTLAVFVALIFYAALTCCRVCAQESDRRVAQSSTPGRGLADFMLSRIDEAVIAEFQKAWRTAGGGLGKTEGVVLLYRKSNGSLIARLQSSTNEYAQFSFRWNSAIIGIVHTHPNAFDPKPYGEDRRVADRFGVPVCTITSRGMFVYDPDARTIRLVKAGLDWLEPSKWKQSVVLASK